MIMSGEQKMYNMHDKEERTKKILKNHKICLIINNNKKENIK